MSQVVKVVNRQEDTPRPLLTVFPNPAGNTVTLKGLIQGCTIEVFDMLGMPCLMYTGITGKEPALDISVLRPGLYTMKCKDVSGNEEMVKFVKE
jgi:hypothetical protein